MKVSDFDYSLPRELIADEPMTPRDASRLLVLDREGNLAHRRFRDLPEHLRPEDVLVVNDTRVVPARLVCYRRSGGRVDALLLGRAGGERWHALLDTSRRLKPGEGLKFDDRLWAKITGKEPDGRWVLEFDSDVEPHLDRLGRAPLPPYIKREARPEDRERYQTVYAARDGAVAAPTAGLHFTRELLARIESMGVLVRRVTLHVGVGTFKPVRVERVEDHAMDAERYEIPAETIAAIRSRRGRVVAVGTTAVRALETWARRDEWFDTLDSPGCAPRAQPGELKLTHHEAAGETDLFIHEPFEFRAVEALVTNFHLPRSTLLMLACAFGGRERVLAAYEEAKRMQYRFFSYGDAMFIG